MQIKNLTLGLALVMTGSALAQPQTYKVKNGDCDWTIARKFDTSIHKLHLANPAVRNWDALQNGFVLRIPNSSVKKAVAHSEHQPFFAPRSASTRQFKVSQDENDWIIAHHLGISLHLLHQLNPGVDWNRLRPGKHIFIPSDESPSTEVAKSSSKASKVKINRIHSRYALINSESVSIRRQAGQRSERITTVNTGTRVVILDRDGPWYKLRFPRGTEGWVRGDYLNPAHAPAVARRRRHTGDSERVVTRRRHRHGSTPEAVVMLDNDTKANPLIKTATAMRGTRYSYGSSSRSATDCSGFIWQVYGSHGIRLPRTSSEQSQVGQPVSTNQLKPGDLVFFSGTRGGRRVGHVGMYVGKNKFIHASSGGGKVQYNSLSDPYYAHHYRTARRILKSGSHKSTVAHKESHESSTHMAAAVVDTNPTPLGK